MDGRKLPGSKRRFTVPCMPPNNLTAQAFDRGYGLKNTILITGGTGFIGSHAVVELMQAGFNVVVLDNLCNSDVGVIERLATICGHAPQFVQGDVRDSALLDKVFDLYRITAVMHFAGLKSVGESWQQAAPV